MCPLTIELPDGSQKELPDGSTGYDLASAIGPRLAKDSIAIVWNDTETRDLHRAFEANGKARIITTKDPEALDMLRHSTAHIMAQAVQNIFPNAKIAIGPTIDHGFYYDFDIPDHKLTPDDLEKIEAEMAKIAQQNQRFERRMIADVDAQLAQFAKNRNPTRLNY